MNTEREISKEEFLTLMKSIRKTEEFLYNINKSGLGLFETPLFDTYGELLDLVWKTNFSTEGVDVINWFIFENHDIVEDFTPDLKVIRNGRLAMYDKDGTIIPMNSFDDLWNYLINYNI